MSTAPEAHLLQSVSTLCEPLHAALERAVNKVRTFREHSGLTHRDYDWLATHMTRAVARDILQQQPPDGWTLTGNHRRNGELWLTRDMMRLRILHTWSESHVPPPGPNSARQAFYTNPALPGMEADGQLALLDASRLLGLWRVTDEETSRVGIRLVRTVGKWTFKQRAKADVNVLLPREIDDFTDLVWTPNDTDIEIVIPAEETQEGEEGGRAE